MTFSAPSNLSITVARLVTDTETHLYGTRRPQMNKMDDSGGINASDTEVGFEFEPGGIRPGSFIEIDDEVMMVWAVRGQIATVERAQMGTTAATHADDSIIRVEPRFWRKQIIDALRDEISSWPPELYGVVQDTITVAAEKRAIDLPGAGSFSGLRLLRAQHAPYTDLGLTSEAWVELPHAALDANQSTASFASGVSLTWDADLRQASTLRVVLGIRFITSGMTSSTDVGAMGLSLPMLDIPPIGAAVRLLFPAEIGRTDDAAMGRSRLAEETPPGHASRTAREMLEWRDRRLADEAKRLLNEYGWKQR